MRLVCTAAKHVEYDVEPSPVKEEESNHVCVEYTSRRGYACIVGSLQMQFVDTLLRLGELAEPTPGRNVIRSHEAPGCRIKKAVMNARRVDVDRIACTFVKQRFLVKVALLPLSLPIVFRQHLFQGFP